MRCSSTSAPAPRSHRSPASTTSRGSTTTVCSTSTDSPSHLVILGGSYVGLELGQLFARFGSAVTIIERGERVAAREDADIAAEIARFLTAEGLDIRTSTTVERVESAGDGVRVHLVGDEPIDGSHLLVAIGRTPNTDRLDLDRVGLHDRRSRLRAHRRRVPHRGRGHLGARRHQRPRGVHPHLLPGLRDPGRSPRAAVTARPTGGSRPTRCSPTHRSAGSA